MRFSYPILLVLVFGMAPFISDSKKQIAPEPKESRE